MSMVGIVVAVLASWWLLGRWERSSGPELVRRVGVAFRWLVRLGLAIVAVIVVAAMAEGWGGDGDDADRDTGGGAGTTATTASTVAPPTTRPGRCEGSYRPADCPVG